MIRMPFEDDCLRVLGRGGREPVRAIGRNVTQVELGEPRDRRELASYLGKYGQASLCSAVDGHSIESPPIATAEICLGTSLIGTGETPASRCDGCGPSREAASWLSDCVSGGVASRSAAPAAVSLRHPRAK